MKVKFFKLRSLLTLIMGVIAFSLSAQTLTVKGTVTDDTGMTVIGATIIEEATQLAELLQTLTATTS